jgi:hypothetical protein
VIRLPGVIVLVAVAASCGDGGTAPATGKAHIEIVAGSGVTDSVDAQPVPPLTVEIRDGRGRVVSDAVVRFQASLPYSPGTEASVFACALTAATCESQLVTDTTDHAGRAQVGIRLGSVPGKAAVMVTVPALGLQDSATFTVTPGAPYSISIFPRDTILDIGASFTISGHAVDRYGNARPELATFYTVAGNVVSLEPASSVVTARDLGSQHVYASLGKLADSATVRVAPTGRLVVWSPSLARVRLIDINGKNARTLIGNVGSDFGVFPRFDPTRQHFTLHSAAPSSAGPSSDAIVFDTTGTRRDVIGFSSIIAVRQINDGNLMVVGRRSVDPNGYYAFRVTADNTITLLRTLDGLSGTYGGADITYDGNRVAYIAGGALNVMDITTGAVTNLATTASSPRWSVQGDRLAYLFPSTCPNDLDGVVTVINADGSARSVLTNSCMSPGLAWSPDGKYVIGRSSEADVGLRIVRVSDGMSVLTHLDGSDYYQPDWR